MSQEELTQVITIVILLSCLISAWWIISSVISFCTKLFYKILDFESINNKPGGVVGNVSMSCINGNITIKGNINSITVNGNKIL